MESQEKGRRESVTFKNYTRMRLLVMLPSFQEAVSRVRSRKEFSIPHGGFQTDAEVDRWLNEKSFSYLELMPEGFYGEKPKNSFRNAIKGIGSRFQLPFNFVNSSFHGIAWYVLGGRLKFLENNWEIDLPLLHQDKKVEWVGIRTFLPLSKVEVKDAVAALRQEQQQLMPSSLTYARRVKKHLANDLEILAYVSKRTGTPRKQKRYERHSYSYYLAEELRKNPTEQNKKELRRAEKRYPSGISVGYDQPVIKDIAKKLRISEDAARQALKRLNKDAVKMFGCGFFGNDAKGSR